MLINNRYRVIKTLGEGGFGQAYLAEDTQMPSGRRCVLKQLKPVATSPEVYQIVQERFQREAATLEKLGENNPQIPRLYAYFSENQKFYLVQEWIEGQTLAALMAAQGPQSESVVCSILKALLPVLDFIHSQGIIHRDIKPENIILRAGLPAAEDQPVLIDFGAVRETMGTMVNSHNSLTSSIVIGTPGYMASEQAAGRPIPSSDLYSLGLVAIYLLTGLPPQSLESDPQTGEIIWRDKVGHVSMPLVSVIARSMRSHPRDRYSSAHEMLAALTGAVNTEQQVSTYQQPSGQAYSPVQNQSAQNQPTVAVNSAGPNTSVNTLYSQSAYSQSASQKSLSPVKMGLIAAAVVAGVMGGGVLISRSAGDSTLQPAASESGTKSDQPGKDAVKGSDKDKADKDKESDATVTTPQSEGTASLPTEEKDEVNLPSADAEVSAVPGGNVTPDNPDSSSGIAQYATLRQDLGLSQVNVYAVPDATTERLHYGLPGDRVTLLDQTQTGGTTWNLVRFDSGAEGWIADSFLTVGAASPAAETVSGAPQLASETCTETYYQVNDPQDTSANLRKSPNGDLIVAIPNGTEVLFLGVAGSWTQVQLGSGQTGYISTQLLNESDCY